MKILWKIFFIPIVVIFSGYFTSWSVLDAIGSGSDYYIAYPQYTNLAWGICFVPKNYKEITIEELIKSKQFNI